MIRLALMILMVFSLSCAGSSQQSQQGMESDPLEDIDPLPPAPSPVAEAEAPVVTQELEPLPSNEPEEEEEEEAPQVIASGPEMWEEYQNERRFDCVGPFDKLPAPYSFQMKGRTAVIDGYSMKVSDPDWGPQTSLKIGIMGATKDSYPETLGNLRRFIRWFEDHKVSVVVVNGDIGYEARDMVKSMELLARTRKLILVMAGNADPVSGFNRVLKEASAKWPNLVNANFVRRVELDGHTLISLPGYYDSEVVNAGSGCQYYRSDVKGLGRLLDEAEGVPVVFSHGPPRGRGKRDIDFAFDAGNVGDKRLAEFLKKRKVSFGVFGHILECGGRAVTATSRKPVKPETWSPNLFVNTGGASSLLADLHDGTSHRGMAGILEVEGNRAQVRWDYLPAD